jgi:hypothetical protein
MEMLKEERSSHACRTGATLSHAWSVGATHDRSSMMASTIVLTSVMRPRVGSGLGFRHRPCFGGPKPTQIMHVDLKCVCMYDVGLGDAVARSQV